MSPNETNIPAQQCAVQLTGPSQLRLNEAKPVPTPTGHQILAKVEATGLCFSDLKLLKQFADHPRKGNVIAGMSQEDCLGISSYMPGDKPTVPGHESIIRIVAVGDQVKKHKVGERCLVQTDYRAMLTEGGSNASFGYNFEGGLQEYVIIDERVARDFNTDERFLIPVSEDRSASAICLVEPWACVENSYQNPERKTILAGGKLLVVLEDGHQAEGLAESFSPDGPPASITVRCAKDCDCATIKGLGVPVECTEDIASLPDEGFDDIVYFGAEKATIEALNSKLGLECIINIVTGGEKIGALVAMGIGRVHYGMMRWVGTTSTNAAEGYKMVPASNEVRDGDTCIVTGAGGPMGQMHVIRNLCVGAKNFSILATDFDDARLAELEETARPFAKANGVDLRIVNPSKTPIEGEKFSYSAIMVPIPALVTQAIADSTENCLINIFAGIPAPTIHEIDLDKVIENRVYMFGTSGSMLRDMKIVLDKIESGSLDTNCSVAAVTGMAGGIEGIAAVENRTLSGKIIVYPKLRELGLTPLEKLGEIYPTVAEKMSGGRWNKEAEQELLNVAK